jgi:hypothetical protein
MDNGWKSQKPKAKIWPKTRGVTPLGLGKRRTPDFGQSEEGKVVIFWPTRGTALMGLQFPGPFVRVCPSFSQSERVKVFLGQSDESNLRLGHASQPIISLMKILENSRQSK